MVFSGAKTIHKRSVQNFILPDSSILDLISLSGLKLETYPTSHVIIKVKVLFKGLEARHAFSNTQTFLLYFGNRLCDLLKKRLKQND